MIKIDSQSNIFIKLYEPNNLVKYFDTNGKLIGDFNENELEKFSRIDITKDDFITCFDRAQNKLIIL